MQVTSSTNSVSKSVIKDTKLVLYIGLLLVVLLSYAIINQIAANWPNISPDQRLLIGQSVFVLSILVALMAGWRSKKLVDLAIQFSALATGALLALIGQIYQTGADAWSLFALWALLITPWLILLRTIFITVLWALLLNITIFLYASNSSVIMLWLTDGNLALLLLNTCLLLATIILQDFCHDNWFVLRKIFATATGVFLFLYLLQQQFEGINIVWQYLLAGGFLVLAYIWFTRKIRDLYIISCVFITAISLISLLVLRLSDDIQGVLILALLVLLASVFASFQLISLWRDWLGVKAGVLPWYFYTLRVVALSLAAVLFLVWLLFSFEFDSRRQLNITALLILLAGLFIAKSIEINSSKKSPKSYIEPNIFYEIALLAVFAGYGLFMAVCLIEDQGLFTNYYVLEVFAVGLVVYLLLANFISRLLSAVIMIGAFLWLVNTKPYVFSGLPIELWPIQTSYFLCLLVLLAVFMFARLANNPYFKPLALALCVWVVLLAIPVDLINSQAVWDWPVSAAVAALAISCLPWVFLMPMLREINQSGLKLKLLALLFLLASLLMAGAFTLSLGLALLVYAVSRQSRSLIVLGAVLAVLGLPLYYFQTATSLGFKSVQFALIALLLFLTVILIKPKTMGKQFYLRINRAYIRITIVCAIAVIVAARYQIRSFENVLQNGQKIILQLAPVDPRSLIQGDYMALDYALRKQANDFLLASGDIVEISENKRYWLILMKDKTSIYNLYAISDDFDEAINEVSGKPEMAVLKAIYKNNSLDWGANSWFFAEGAAAKFEQAKFGVLSLADNGTALLYGLLDKNLQSIN